MSLLIIPLIVIIDQITKFIVKTKLMPIGNIDLIQGVFSLSYVENRGAAFGLFRDNKFLLIGATTIVTFFIIYYIVKTKKLNKFYKFSLLLIASGAIGNLIDRVVLGYVVDFFHFYLTDIFDFPVFNVADISVVVGTALLIICLIFVKENEIDKNEKLPMD